MQITSIIALIALTVSGVAASPAKPAKNAPAAPKPKPKPEPPVVNIFKNQCGTGDPYCCSPTSTDSKEGTTCVRANTQCNAITICCANVNFGDGPINQNANCAVAANLQQPVSFVLTA